MIIAMHIAEETFLKDYSMKTIILLLLAFILNISLTINASCQNNKNLIDNIATFISCSHIEHYKSLNYSKKEIRKYSNSIKKRYENVLSTFCNNHYDFTTNSDSIYYVLISASSNSEYGQIWNNSTNIMFHIDYMNNVKYILNDNNSEKAQEYNSLKIFRELIEKDKYEVIDSLSKSKPFIEGDFMFGGKVIINNTSESKYIFFKQFYN